MGKAGRTLSQLIQWDELRDIYTKVLKHSWDIQVERVREDGTYIFKLTNCNLKFSDLQVEKLFHIAGTKDRANGHIYRVLSPMDKDQCVLETQEE